MERRRTGRTLALLSPVLLTMLVSFPIAIYADLLTFLSYSAMMGNRQYWYFDCFPTINREARRAHGLA
jgi:hypothetical protein